MLRRALNAFQRVLQKEAATDTRLGCPLQDQGARLRRRETMSRMTGGRGFYVFPKGPKLSRGGTTRAEREAASKARTRANLEAERRFREAHSGKPGWGIGAIRDAIESRQHLTAEA